jgi:transposase
MFALKNTRVRTLEPNRSQVVVRFEVAEDALPPDHPARLIWEVTGTLDLSHFLVGIKAREGGPGRSALSPRTKLVLWLYAVSRGIGSARQIVRCLQTDLAFRWITGERSVHHDTLSAFRAEQGQAFDQLLTTILGALVHKGTLSLEYVAQDGLRVRASASAPSFRSRESLQQCREQAALHLKAVLAQADELELSRQHQATREGKAKDFVRRVDEAIELVEQLHKEQEPPPSKPSSSKSSKSSKPRPPRASTTDRHARVMKMADGGFRPAYNVQLATAGSPLGGPRTIVGVQVTSVGSDMGAIPSMLQQVERRTGQMPKVLLADAGHASHADIRYGAEHGVKLLIPVPERSREPGMKAEMDPAIVSWRELMRTEEAQQLYKARASLCELSNAHQRSQFGLQQFLVRGLTKVLNVALLGAIAANLLQHTATLLS